MSESDCHRVVREAADLGVSDIAFSGGEPLLWSYLPMAIADAVQRGIRAKLYTSGTVPDVESILRSLRQVGLGEVAFSLHGASAEIHDRITGVPGSFEATLRSIGVAVSLRFRTEVHFVPLATNYQELEALARISRNLKLSQVSVLRFVAQGRGARASDLVLSPQQNMELRSSIDRLRLAGTAIRTGSPFNFLLINEDQSCRAGIDRLTIGPDLDIFPCDAFKHISPIVLGAHSRRLTLGESTLMECWTSSPYLTAVRELIAQLPGEKCRVCRNHQRCGSGCLGQKLHTGISPFDPDPACLAQPGLLGEYRTVVFQQDKKSVTVLGKSSKKTPKIP